MTTQEKNSCHIYIIKSGVCLFVCQHFNVQLTSPPVLKLWNTQGYLWLPYDLTEVIKLIGGRFFQIMCASQKVRTLTSPPVFKLWDTQGYLWLSYDLSEVINLIGVTFKYFFFQKKKYFMSFLLHYCHSFRITLIPSRL